MDQATSLNTIYGTTKVMVTNICTKDNSSFTNSSTYTTAENQLWHDTCTTAENQLWHYTTYKVWVGTIPRDDQGTETYRGQVHEASSQSIQQT